MAEGEEQKICVGFCRPGRGDLDVGILFVVRARRNKEGVSSGPRGACILPAGDVQGVARVSVSNAS